MYLNDIVNICRDDIQSIFVQNFNQILALIRRQLQDVRDHSDGDVKVSITLNKVDLDRRYSLLVALARISIFMNFFKGNYLSICK